MFICYTSTGLKFWKCGSRKLYAVELTDVVAGSGGSGGSRNKRQRDDSDNVQQSVEECLNEVKMLRSEVKDVLSVTKSSKLPVGLKVLLINSFKCGICQDIIHPPIIYSRCCQALLGCEACVDRWYGGDEGRRRSCPLCRRERGFTETGRIRGLDDFLTGIQVYNDDNSSTQEDSD